MNFVERATRSWRLIRASIAVLNSDGELLILPAISGIVTALVVGGFVAQAVSDGTFEALKDGDQSFTAMQGFYGWLLVVYVVQYFVIIFFNTALVGAALERMDGRDPTVRSALGLALRRIGPIMGYAVISATVGVILRIVADRLGFIGRLIEAGVGIAWTLATFLVVPVLAAEGVGPIEAIEKSGRLLRQSWGENVIGNAGISLVFSAIGTVVILVFLAGGWTVYNGPFQTLGLCMMAVGVMLMLALMLLGAALSAVYAAAVYYYAVVGEPPEGFDRDLIHDAFTPKA